jgi:hypothetical protein
MEFLAILLYIGSFIYIISRLVKDKNTREMLEIIAALLILPLACYGALIFTALLNPFR